MRRRHVYRSIWWTLGRWCVAGCALYLVLAGIEWAVKTAPYVVVGGLSVAALALASKAVR